MKKTFILVFLLVFAIVFSVSITYSKYASVEELNFLTSTTPFYFNHTASDVTLCNTTYGAIYDFDVKNFVGDNITLENVPYTISIDNSDYIFSVNNNYATSNSLNMTINGGTKQTQNLEMIFERMANGILDFDEINVTITVNTPYIYQDTFKVNILSDPFSVTGNVTEWTNQDITLTAISVADNVNFTNYSFDGGASWQNSNSKTYQANESNIVIYAKDSDNTIYGPVTENITKIDKVAPTLDLPNATEYNSDGSTKTVKSLITDTLTTVSVTSNVTYSDSLSGIDSNGLRCYRNGSLITDTSMFTNAGRYGVTYKIKDNAGNETELERDVLVRWPLAGKYILARQTAVGTGLSSSSVGAGLYQDNADTGVNASLPYTSKYYYSGAQVDNYVSFPNTNRSGNAATTWRVINVSQNDSVKIISENYLDSTYQLHSSNINDFANMNIKTKLESWVSSGNVGDSSNDYHLNFSSSGHIDTGVFYIGAVTRPLVASNSSMATEVNQERTVTSKTSNPAYSAKLGFINVTDVVKTSSSEHIYNVRSMQNYYNTFSTTSWIYKGSYEWSMNAHGDSNNQMWRLDDKQFLSHYSKYTANLRMVVFLKNNTILSGTGSSSDPFVVQEDWRWFDPYQTKQ